MNKHITVALAAMLLVPGFFSNAAEAITVEARADGFVKWNIGDCADTGSITAVLPELCIFKECSAADSIQLAQWTYLPWSAECPTTYTLELRYDGKLVTLHVPFRDVEVADGGLVVNGCPVEVKIGDRRDVNPAATASDDLQVLREDILALKLAGFTAVPACSPCCDARWYSLCDRYGLYAVDTAEVSSSKGNCSGISCYDADALNGKICVCNDFYFRGTAYYECRWSLAENGDTLLDGVVRDFIVAPRDTAILDLGYSAEDLGVIEGKDIELNVSWVLRYEDGILKPGAEVSRSRIVICDDYRPAPAFVKGNVQIADSDSSTTVSSAGLFEISFDKLSGNISSYTMAGRELLASPVMPCDNKILESFDVSEGDGCAVVTAIYSPESVDGEYSSVWYEIYSDGSVRCHVQAPGHGMRFSVPDSYSSATQYRCAGSPEYKSLTFSGSEGFGLMLTALQPFGCTVDGQAISILPGSCCPEDDFIFAISPVLPEAPADIVPAPAAMYATEDWCLPFYAFSITGGTQELDNLVDTFLQVSATDGVKYRKARYGFLARVVLSVDESLAPEAYTVSSKGLRICIAGGSARGVWWGLQTLRQLAIQGRGKYLYRIPALYIYDAPQFAIRASHLDVCRHFFGVDDVKSWLDMMAMHKLNTFHWHLTDNEGWRIEIKSVPALTEIGSQRRETIEGHYYASHDYDGIPYGGYYTQDQIREIVAYAAARQIDIIPEIETPGHCLAALASCPETGCRGWGYETGRGTGSTPDVFCPGKDTTFAILYKVLDEVCDLFPYKYIHIGGDEVRKNNWAVCPDCQARMQAEGLADLNQLQSWFIRRIEEHLETRDRSIIGWDEILDGGVSRDAVVMSWRGTAGGIKAAKMGNDVLMAPSTYFYFDSPQYDDFSDVENMVCGEYRGYRPLEKVFAFDPTRGLSLDEQAHIIGVEATMWTELVSDLSRAQLLTLPRLAAMSERAWGSGRTSFDSFVSRTDGALVPLYKAAGYNYATREFEK